MLDDGPATSGSLLDRLHTWSDRSAWQRFFTNYNSSPRSLTRPRLHNPADAQELVQILWCELARRLRSFRYNPRQSFRGWLRCLHTCRLSDFRKAERRRFAREHQYTTEAEPPAIHHITTAASDTPNALAANSRWNGASRIQAAVRKRVSPKSWDIFHDVAILGLELSETANRHHMRYASALGRLLTRSPNAPAGSHPRGFGMNSASGPCPRAANCHSLMMTLLIPNSAKNSSCTSKTATPAALNCNWLPPPAASHSQPNCC
ncbi:MAG UNVERIFIED_CONTAM: hypothetical protein LVR18_06460 [Planctomycetaceae bacterium]|jgi:DNA-directed RNA polymerase specialized sigma24 family protein